MAEQVPYQPDALRWQHHVRREPRAAVVRAFCSWTSPDPCKGNRLAAEPG